MSRKKTVLILGISSYIGSNFAHYLKSEYRVIGTYYQQPVDVKGILTIKCDVTDKTSVQKIVFLFKPDITIYAAGLSKMSDCQKFPKLADALNTVGVFNATSASERYKSKFVLISSCFIFSGEDILFHENDTPMPSSVYGNTMASSEFYVQKSCLNYLIFRTCPVLGYSYNPNDLSWLEVVEKNNHLAKKIPCDSKVFHGFIDFETLVDAFKIAIEKNITNRLFQISSTDIMSRYEFTKLYLKERDGNESLLVRSDWGFPRTENKVALQDLEDELRFFLDTANIEEGLGMTMPTIAEVVQRIMSRQSQSKVKSAKSGDGAINFI